MKLRGLFLRMFWAFLAVMLVTAAVLSSMMVVMVRSERATALENMRLGQARDVARLLRQYNITLNSPWPSDSSVGDILRWKIDEIRATGDADVWLVAPNRRVLVLGSNAYEQALSDEEVVRQVDRVLSGEEIRVQGLIRELGGHMTTIGVPWRDARGRVDGAVLFHISTASLSVDYSDLIRNAAIAAAVAMALGALLAFAIARRQTEPIRQIRLAVKDFSEGRLERRVMVRADEELVELAEAFNRMAEDLSQLEDSRRSFVANVSHELRSPLTSIRGYIVGLLDGTIEFDEREKYLRVALQESERLGKLVSELLDLSRIEAGALKLAPTRFDLCELLRQELIKFEGRVEARGLTVEVDLPGEALWVMADADRVRQIATNLLDNAVKFAHGRIGLRAWDAGEACHVSVSNDGPPIAHEDQAYIFDRFYKADKAHTAGGGTGLGLAIVKKILDQMGRRVWLESEPEGTAFFFDLGKA